MARILLVEDEDTQRKALETMLRAAGHQVFLASNGAQALLVAQDKKPDLIVSDLAMPKITGKELCEKIRAAPATREIYLIVVTALEGEVPRLESMLAGADDFVRKPVQREDLVNRVDIGVRMRACRRESAAHLARAVELQQTQDLLVAAVDAGMRGLEEAASKLQTGDAIAAMNVLKRAHEEVRQALAKVPAPPEGGA